MSANCELSSYDELIQLLDSLPFLVREKRRRERLSLRSAAKQMGISFATISRVETGDDCNLSNAVTLLRWLSQHKDGDEK